MLFSFSKKHLSFVRADVFEAYLKQLSSFFYTISNRSAIFVTRNPEQLDFQEFLKSLPAEVLKEARGTVEERGDLHADYIIQSLTEVPAIVQAEKGKTGSHL